MEVERELTIKEMADFIGVTERTLRKLLTSLGTSVLASEAARLKHRENWDNGTYDLTSSAPEIEHYKQAEPVLRTGPDRTVAAWR